jgi:hypothetical protein
MTTNFKKLALAVGVTAGLAAVSMPSQALITGAAGEALLVPLVVYGGLGTSFDPFVNTVIRVTIPSTVGFDTIPNEFTAPHTTPTNPGPTLFPADKDLAGGNYIHWYWFDKRSLHRLNRKVKVTADDVVEINWRYEAGTAWVDQAGYMIIGTEAARSGAAANFAMYGDAWLLFDDPTTVRTFTAYQPVLPMSDGADGPQGTPVSVDDQVKYTAGGIPRNASPLISGMRTNRSDGDLSDATVWDLALSDRTFPTIQVIWLDTNLGSGNYVAVDVFDTTELTCSGTIPLPYELNVVWVPSTYTPEATSTYTAPRWVTQDEVLCTPHGSLATDNGFVRYVLPEYRDTNIDAPETAGATFSLTYEPAVGVSGLPYPNALEAATNIGHERGTYKF